MVEIGISKPNGCQVLGPIFLESTTPGVFKTDIREIADFHPSETLDQNQKIWFRFCAYCVVLEAFDNFVKFFKMMSLPEAGFY